VMICVPFDQCWTLPVEASKSLPRSSLVLARGATSSSSPSSTSEWVGVSGSSPLPPQARSDSACSPQTGQQWVCAAVGHHVAEQVNCNEPGVIRVHAWEGVLISDFAPVSVSPGFRLTRSSLFCRTAAFFSAAKQQKYWWNRAKHCMGIENYLQMQPPSSCPQGESQTIRCLLPLKETLEII